MRKKKKIVISLISVFLIGIYIFFYSYFSKEYKSLINEKIALENISNVKIDISKDIIVLLPKEKSEIGIIFYPGAKVDYRAYLRMASLISQHGIAVYIPKMPLNFAIFDSDRFKEVIETNKNIKKWYLAGHSLGGAAISKYLETDERIKGIIYFASYPTKTINSSKKQVLAMFGSQDGLITKEKREEKVKLLPENAQILVIEGGNHAGFGNYGTQDNDGQAIISAEEQQEIAAETVNKFINKK